MRGISRRSHRRPGPLSSTIAVAGAAVLLVVILLALRDGRATEGVPGATSTTVDELAGLDPQARCDRAAALVTARRNWPMTCRWREPGDGLQGQAFPPLGDPPYDNPRIEIYVDPAQSANELARAIAHELGHMHHTRDPRFVPEWLSARGLPPGTPDEIWTEDYAEVFTALFAPQSERWRATTLRPSPETLAGLRARFFGDA